MHIIRFEFMGTVFSQIEQIGALRFVDAFLLLLYCLQRWLVSILSWSLMLALDSDI